MVSSTPPICFNVIVLSYKYNFTLTLESMETLYEINMKVLLTVIPIAVQKIRSLSDLFLI
jgi:hypothetical protein